MATKKKEEVKEVKDKAVAADNTKPRAETLHNESQETMFDKEINICSAEYTHAVRQVELWKSRVKSHGKDLIEHMKRLKINTLTVGTDKIIKYKYTDASEKIILKDYKPQTKRRRRV